MKKYLKILIAVLIFVPFISVHADEVVERIDIAGRVDYGTIEPGPLGWIPLTVMPNQHVSVEQFMFGNTTWVRKGTEEASWSDFGEETQEAVHDNSTIYGIRVKVKADAGYQITEDTIIAYRTVTQTIEDQDYFEIQPMSWGAYVYINLGKATDGTIHTVTVDLNGGTKDGNGSYTYETETTTKSFSVDYLMDGVTPPTGKELDNILINDATITDLPFTFRIDHNIVITYVWKDAEVIPEDTEINNVTITGITLPKQNQQATTSGIAITSPGLTIKSMKWLDEATGAELFGGNVFAGNKHYILVIEFELQSGFKLPANDLGGEYIHLNVAPNMKEFINDRVELRLYYTSQSAQKATIKFNANGGTVATTSKTYYVGDSYGLLPPAVKKGYTLAGWYDAATGGNKIESTMTITGSKTLYAHWAKTKYTINYELNGGTNNTGNPATYTITSAKITFKNPTRKGYIFKGWYKESTFKTKVTYLAKGSVGNRTLYAKWTPITYKITFNKNGGTGTMTAQTGLKYNKAYYLKANAFKRKGYSFAGWNRKADGTGAAFTNKQAVKNLSATNGGNVVLYARWKKVKYTITYNLNGGTNNSSNPAAYYITTATITLKNPTRKGYIFAGWYSDAKFKTKVTKIVKGSTGNKKLYAKWTPIKYSIKFNANGGTGTLTNQTGLKYNTAYTLKANTFKKSGGYVFVGWNTKADGSGVSYANKAAVKNLSAKNGAVVTLYAQWQKGDKVQALNRAKALIKTDALGWSYTRVVFELEDVEKYTHAAAVYAADNCGADWNYEALRWATAQLKHTYYSRANLLHALVEYDWFTSEQAEYAVNNVLEAVGTTWNNQAVRAASSIEFETPFSRQKLYNNLINLGFTESEANYGVDNSDIDWNEQAARAALNYLQFNPTYEQLVEWLKEDELFTHDQAVAGATAAMEMHG